MVSDHPRAVVWAALGVAVACGWAAAAAMVAAELARGTVAGLGPGMGLLDLLGDRFAPGPLAQAILDTLCAPAAGGGWAAADIGYCLAMWAAMVLAMMLPTAGPMLSTYLDIAEAAEARRMAVVPASALALGYIAAWLAFAICAVAVQWAIAQLVGGLSAAAAPPPWVAGIILVAAGGYQFSSAKHACLVRCRAPMPYFLANWSDRFAGVFAMGLHQGVLCIGCCWALMAVMLGVGVMNILWMAPLAILMMLEKVAPWPRAVSAAGGSVLILGGTLMLARAMLQIMA